MRDLLRYRMSQANDSLREASILRNATAPRGAVNRAYYAMFYALLALLRNGAATRKLGRRVKRCYNLQGARAFPIRMCAQ